MDFVFQAVVALAFPYFSWELPVCLGSRRHRFLRSVCLSGRDSLHFFVGEGSQTRPQCAAAHSSFGTEKKIATFPKITVLIFFFIRSVIKICRCRRFDSCKSEKSSLRADLERAIIFLRKERTGSSSHDTGFTFGPTQCFRYHRPTHLQFRPNRLLKRETERLFNSMKRIMINHEQLNPLVGWRSLTLPSSHREWKAKVFFLQRVTFAFFGSPSWYASYYRFRGEHRSVIV